MRKHLLFSVVMVCSFVISGCARDEGSPSGPGRVGDPTILVDTFEREVLKGCSGEVVSDKIERRAAVNNIKINPEKNIFIAAASFFNLENGEEFTPSGVWFPGEGGDNLKNVKFCQAPRVAGCDLSVKAGPNRLEYKYWQEENPDVMGENKVRTISFTVLSETSTKTCYRTPTSCPLGSSPSWSACVY